MSDSVLTHPQFLLLQAIAKQSCCASELAQTVNVSLPYVLSQLKLLEAKGIVSKYQVKDHSVGKPKQNYEIATTISHITLVTPYGVTKQKLSADKLMQQYLHIAAQLPSKIQTPFSQYFWSNQPELKNVQAFALLTVGGDGIELLGITTAEHLDALRKNSSSFKQKGESRFNIACWMHTLEEINIGLHNKDEYYLRLRSQIKTLYDPHKRLEEITNEQTS